MARAGSGSRRGLPAPPCHTGPPGSVLPDPGGPVASRAPRSLRGRPAHSASGAPNAATMMFIAVAFMSAPFASVALTL